MPELVLNERLVKLAKGSCLIWTGKLCAHIDTNILIKELNVLVYLVGLTIRKIHFSQS